MRFFFFIILLALCSCGSFYHKDHSTNFTKTEKDSLMTRISILEDSIKKLNPKKTEPIIETPSIELSKIRSSTQEEIHYFTNGKVSVIFHPWKESKQQIDFFDAKGNQTYSCTNVHLSYTVRYELKYRNDGSVSEMIEHSNPGASMYSYVTYYEFDSQNNPLNKRTEAMPPSSLEEMMNNHFTWDIEKKLWLKKTW
jgi:hypothetical protein